MAREPAIETSRDVEIRAAECIGSKTLVRSPACCSDTKLRAMGICWICFQPAPDAFASSTHYSLLVDCPSAHRAFGVLNSREAAYQVEGANEWVSSFADCFGRWVALRWWCARWFRRFTALDCILLRIGNTYHIPSVFVPLFECNSLKPGEHSVLEQHARFFGSGSWMLSHEAGESCQRFMESNVVKYPAG